MVAGKTRVMEDEFIAPGGTDVIDAFRMYLRPLLGSGMPDAFRLRDHPVAKVLRVEGEVEGEAAKPVRHHVALAGSSSGHKLYL